MQGTKRPTAALALVALLLLSLSPSWAQPPGPQAAPRAQSPLGTGFTYQGFLTSDGNPVEDDCDFLFGLWDDPITGTLTAGPLEQIGVPVADGRFTVQIDFGDVFQETALWLEVAVLCPGVGDIQYTTLPRQPLTAAPYALYSNAVPWSGIVSMPAGFADNVDDDTTYNPGAGLNLVGTTFNVVTSTVQQRVTGACGEGYAIREISQDGSVVCEPDDDTTYTGGTGLLLSGTVFSVTTPYRLPQGCTGGQIAEWNNSLAQWDCGDDDDTAYGAGFGLNLLGTTFHVVTSTVQQRVAAACGAGSAIRVINADGTVLCETDDDTIGFWSLTGNNGTSPGTDFLGTTDNVAVELRANSARALRLEPHGTSPNLIGGYGGNSVTAGAYGATIGGGGASGFANRVTDEYGTVGGGNINQAGDDDATPDTAPYATVGGGQGNTAAASFATVGGGEWNTASGDRATVGGGGYNTADGFLATIPGGYSNSAQGDYSLAAGYRARANGQGCFVWGDSTSADITCSDENRTIFRSTGGFYIYTDNGSPPSGLYLAAGGSAWNTHSDRDVKENFQPVDTQQLLAQLAEVPITSWNYKSQDPAIRHVGPMAQDFNALLPGLGGEGETYINTLDADGVALAAIQGLYAHNQELQAENTALRTESVSQQAQIDDLEARLAALEKAIGDDTLPVPPWPAGLLSGMGLLLAATGLVCAGRRHQWVGRRKDRGR